jgi:hypothetical protein
MEDILSAIGTWLPGPTTYDARQSMIGQDAPEFQMKDQDGNNVTLRRLTRTGPVLMHLYRGNW